MDSTMIKRTLMVTRQAIVLNRPRNGNTLGLMMRMVNSIPNTIWIKGMMKKAAVLLI